MIKVSWLIIIMGIVTFITGLSELHETWWGYYSNQMGDGMILTVLGFIGLHIQKQEDFVESLENETK